MKRNNEAAVILSTQLDAQGWQGHQCCAVFIHSSDWCGTRDCCLVSLAANERAAFGVAVSQAILSPSRTFEKSLSSFPFLLFSLFPYLSAATLFQADV